MKRLIGGIMQLIRLLYELFKYKTFRRIKFWFYNNYDIGKSDDELLITRICYDGHHLEKAIKHSFSENLGKDRANRLKKMVEAARKRNLKQEKIIEEKLGLLNRRKNNLNGQIAVYQTQLSTIDTIRTKVEDLTTYVEKQLADIKNDLETVDLTNIHEKIQFLPNQIVVKKRMPKYPSTIMENEYICDMLPWQKTGKKVKRRPTERMKTMARYRQHFGIQLIQANKNNKGLTKEQVEEKIRSNVV